MGRFQNSIALAKSSWQVLRDDKQLTMLPLFSMLSTLVVAVVVLLPIGLIVRDGSGGYSGPALKPVALHAVRACAEATSLPIVGMGGVTTGRDVLEFLACGATDVALGTVLFSDPDTPARVRAELAAACADAGVASPDDAVGLAKTPETEVKVTA